MTDNIKSIVGNTIGTMNGNMLVGDTYNNYYQIEKVENISKIDGNNNINLQGIYNSTVSINIQISEELFQKNNEIILSVAKDTNTIKQIQNLHTDILLRIESKLDGKLALRKYITSPPGVTDYFIGRTQTLIDLHDKLFKSSNRFILLVNGEGGIGKTTFAAAYCRQYEREYQHIAWVTNRENIREALLTLEMPLKLTIEGLNQQQRIEQLRTYLRNLSLPCLLVIDNSNDKTDIENNMHLLKACNNFHLLLTTRVINYEHKDNIFQIDSLPFDVTKQLFADIYPDYCATDDPLLQSIYDAVGGNTLVIELIAKNLKETNSKKKNVYSMRNLLEDIQNKGLLGIAAQKTGISDHWTYIELKKQTPTEVITALFDIAKLKAAEKQLLTHITLLPVESIKYEVFEKLFENYADFENLFESLDRKGWLNFNLDERAFRFSPVVQQVCATQNPQTATDAQILIYNLNEQLEREGEFFIRNTVETAAVFARYAETVVSAFRHNANYDLAALCERIGNYNQMSGDFDKALQFFNLRTQFGKELYKANPKSENLKNGLAVSYSKLGEIYQSLGDLEKALQFFNLYNQLSKELYEANPKSENLKNGLAISYSKLGAIYQSLGDLDKALQFFNLQIQFFKELYEANPKSENLKNGLANSYGMTGDLYLKLGKIDEGLANIEKATDLFNELYEANPKSENLKNGLAISYEKLGEIYQSLGDLDKALQFFNLDIQLSKELYEANPKSENLKNGLAISYQNLGNIYQSLGDLDNALQFFNLQIQLFKELYEANPKSENLKNGLAISYSKLGAIYQSLGDLDKALQFFNLRTQLGKELYEANPKNIGLLEGLAVSYYKLAMVYKAKRDDKNGKMQFAEWKGIISYLAKNIPQVSKYKDWNNLEY